MNECFRFKDEWSYLPIVKFLTFGFKKEELARFFDSVPPRVALEFKRTLEKVESILNERIKHLTSVPILSTSLPEESDVPEAADENDYEADMWKDQNICGFLKANFDALSQEILEIQLNDKFSELLGTNREEFLKLAADHSLPLPFSEVDFLFLLIDETKHSTKSRTDRFQANLD
jgi:hypothetical protein